MSAEQQCHDAHHCAADRGNQHHQVVHAAPGVRLAGRCRMTSDSLWSGRAVRSSPHHAETPAGIGGTKGSEHSVALPARVIVAPPKLAPDSAVTGLASFGHVVAFRRHQERHPEQQDRRHQDDPGRRMLAADSRNTQGGRSTPGRTVPWPCSPCSASPRPHLATDLRSTPTASSTIIHSATATSPVVIECTPSVVPHHSGLNRKRVAVDWP